jgi:hypothetical protein
MRRLCATFALCTVLGISQAAEPEFLSADEVRELITGKTIVEEQPSAVPTTSPNRYVAYYAPDGEAFMSRYEDGKATPGSLWRGPISIREDGLLCHVNMYWPCAKIRPADPSEGKAGQLVKQYQPKNNPKTTHLIIDIQEGDTSGVRTLVSRVLKPQPPQAKDGTKLPEGLARPTQQ